MGLERAEGQPTAPQGNPLEEFVMKMAAALQLSVVKKNPNLFVIPFSLPENRKQNAFVFAMGKSPLGHHVVGFFSPALKLTPGQDLNAKAANQFLRRNATLFTGAWTLVTFDGADYLGMQATIAAETAQPDEFRAAGLSVAAIADSFEKELGADLF